MRKKTGLTLFLCAAMGLILLSGCGEAASAEGNTGETGADREEELPSYTEEFFAMDTFMTLTAYGEYAQEAVEAGVAEIERLDELLSTGDEGSEIYALNAAGGGELSEETAYLVRRSLEVYESTGGLYDISIYPVMVLWGFAGADSAAFAVPETSVLEETLSHVDFSKLVLTEEESGTAYLSMEEGMQIDLGGIVKGYADDRIGVIFEEYGIEGATINLGGDVRVIGYRPDGSLWRVGIRDPEDSAGYLGGLALTDATVVTSGGYERYFEDEETGIRYHHIIDPRNGYSANNGLISVSVVSDDGTLADALSTALFVMGTEDAIAYCEEHCEADGFGVLLEDEEGEIYITDTLVDSFIDLNGGTELQIIETH